MKAINYIRSVASLFDRPLALGACHLGLFVNVQSVLALRGRGEINLDLKSEKGLSILLDVCIYLFVSDYRSWCQRNVP
jgi:hypothetical protein